MENQGVALADILVNESSIWEPEPVCVDEANRVRICFRFSDKSEIRVVGVADAGRLLVKLPWFTSEAQRLALRKQSLHYSIFLSKIVEPRFRLVLSRCDFEFGDRSEMRETGRIPPPSRKMAA